MRKNFSGTEVGPASDRGRWNCDERTGGRSFQWLKRIGIGSDTKSIAGPTVDQTPAQVEYSDPMHLGS